MLQTLDQIVSERNTPTSRQTWAAIPEILNAKVAAGASKSSVAKVRSAVNGLLKVKGLLAENAFVRLSWFDKTFPEDGWDPATMPFEQRTYRDYRNRVRPLLAEMLGDNVVKKRLRAMRDEWDDAATKLEGLDAIAGRHSARKMIPIRSTLTMAARRAGVEPGNLDQAVLEALHQDAKKSEKPSLRSASRIIAAGQEVSPEIARLFPHRIVPIEAAGAFRYNVPMHFRPELEELVERAARKQYIRAKKLYEYVKETTRTGMRTTLHAAVDGLIATGHLNPAANTFSGALENPEALQDLLGHIIDRIGEDGINARHATTLVRRLPIILDRNGMESQVLREMIAEVEELGHHSDKAGMPERTKQLCRALIEKRKLRTDFLLAHARPRLIAQELLDAAARDGRDLTLEERRRVIRHGTVALFCALEIGGAPVRVENVLEMPFGGGDAWMQLIGKNVQVVIPAAYVKNGKEIRFTVEPGVHRFAETIHWYIETIRPLVLTNPATGRYTSSPWLVPMLSDPSRPCPYETFHGWFVRIMRDVVGVPCTPHNYRHGQASLLYHRYPERIGWIAVRLGDLEDTVIHHYAWVHAERAMADGQRLIVEMIET